MQKSNTKYIILFSIFILPLVFYLLLFTGEHEYSRLSYFGNKEVITKEDGTIDTLYHTIPEFSFINQDGDPFTNEDMLGKIYVVDFFFTSCPTICPKLSANFKYIQDNYQFTDDFGLLSITIDPKRDTPEKLTEYSKVVLRNPKIWNFVTTDNKEDIYELAEKGFMMNAMKDDSAPGGFLHSEFFVLVDKHGHIRGYFDGTIHKEVKQDLFDAIDILIKEEFVPLKGTKMERIEQRREK